MPWWRSSGSSTTAAIWDARRSYWRLTMSTIALPPGRRRDSTAGSRSSPLVWDAAPDTSYLVDEMVVQGDLVATRWRFHGNHVKDFGGLPTKDKEIGFTAIMIHRVEDGVITEGWMEFNGMAMLAQIGLLPGPPA